MTITTKFNYDEKVIHRLNGYVGHVVGISIRAGGNIEYEVLPPARHDRSWANPIWIHERYLEKFVYSNKIGYVHNMEQGEWYQNRQEV